MILLLASVRDEDEAVDATEAGADLIDLKDPSAGALGALSPETICRTVAVLRERWPRLTLSATAGDHEPTEIEAKLHAVSAVAACGVDLVKVGIEPGPYARVTLAELARLGADVVPVFLADRGLDTTLVTFACHKRFPAIMADTADKHAGSLFDCVPVEHLQQMLEIAHAHGVACGLAGSLQMSDLPRLHALAPDFAGFRTALCEGARGGRLSRGKVAALRAVLQDSDPAGGRGDGKPPNGFMARF